MPRIVWITDRAVTCTEAATEKAAGDPTRMRSAHSLFADHWSDCERAMHATSLQELQAQLAHFASRLGFRNHGFASKQVASPLAHGTAYVQFHDFTGEWGDSYRLLDTPQAEASDPRILQARAWLPPVSWNSLGHSSYVLPRQIHVPAKRKLMQAGEFGLHSGITVPLHAPDVDWAFITLTTQERCAPREHAWCLPIAAYYAACLQASLQRLASLCTTPRVELTPHECECLRWSAMGKTSWEISIIRNISERTVNFHLSRAASKLGVRGRRAAVAQALARGAIRL